MRRMFAAVVFIAGWLRRAAVAMGCILNRSDRDTHKNAESSLAQQSVGCV